MSNLEIPTNSNNESIPELQEWVRRSSKVHVCGSRTKSGFHPLADGAVTLSTQALQGVVSYDPQEFVITMLSGTKVSEVVAILAKQGQYLPFDPLFAKGQATIGGTVASNAAGPGRFRFGGIRDFILGVRFIDGRGNCIRGGGQVVKNAAGFDYPKLMVGSQGKLGLVYELTFKVFPRPESFVTVLSRFTTLEPALTCMNQLASSAIDVEAIDLIPGSEAVGGFELAIRIGGIASAIPNRLTRLQQVVPACLVLKDHEDDLFWQAASNFDWVPDSGLLLKLPITPRMIPELERQWNGTSINRRYSVGGNVAWIATEANAEMLDGIDGAQSFLGPPCKNGKIREPGPFAQAIQRALDPDLKFV